MACFGFWSCCGVACFWVFCGIYCDYLLVGGLWVNGER